MIGPLVLLVVLLLFFFIVVAIGHGVWLIGESLIRAFTRTSASFPNSIVRPEEFSNDALGDLLVTERQLSKLHLTGSLDDATFRHLVELIDIERAKLRTPPSVGQAVKTAITPKEPLHKDLPTIQKSEPQPAVLEEFAELPLITPPSVV